MYPLHALPIHLLLVIAQWTISPVNAVATGPTSRSLSTSRLPRLVRRAHANAIHKTHSLARDLRVAFGQVLPRDEDSYDRRPVVYCKAGQQVLSHNDDKPQDNNGNPTDDQPNSTETGSTRRSSSTSKSSSTRRSSTSTAAGSNPAPTPPSSPSSPWKLANSYRGNSFFEGWDFFTDADPTHGIVDYIDEAAGRSAGLVDINGAGNAIMRVETTPTVPGDRKSIRITSRRQFNGGLVILDAVHMPTGCGTWPAFWTNGPDWPRGGEIDILEAVHEYTNNQATLHTSAGCTISSTSSEALDITGRVIAHTNCDVGATSNQGCGIRASSPLSYGKGFNENGGGVYAMKWDDTGIAIYFFPRGLIPADIADEAPQPDSWGAAQARWPASGCDPFKFFRDQHVIFDTTLCGDWAGGVWDAAGIPGQEQSCAQRTGVRTCDEYVRRNGAAFNDAYWEVKSVKIYDPRN